MPGFLIPYSIIPIEPIFEAANKYINEPETSQQSAAFTMCCENPLSFRLHFSRIKELLPEWIALLVQMFIDLGGKIMEGNIKNIEFYEQPLQAEWKRFMHLIMDYFSQHQKLPNLEIIKRDFYYQYIHAVLSINRMGLGP